MNEKHLTLLFLREDDKILLAMKKRGFGEGRWNGVGGKVEDGETIEAAMVREAQEEIGITPTRFEKVADMIFDEFFKGQPALMHVHAFFADTWAGDPRESDEMRPEWFSTDSLPYDEMWSVDRYWLPIALVGKKLKGSFKLDQADEVISQNIIETNEL